MKFKTNTTITIPEEQLQTDYAAAPKQEKSKLGEKCLYIAHTLYTEYIPYEAIERAYRRVEDVRGKLCCGVTTYEIHHLVMVIGGKEVTVLLEFKDVAQKALEHIAEVNYSPLTEVGACDYPVVPTIISPTFVTQLSALMSHHGTVDTLSGFAPLTA